MDKTHVYTVYDGFNGLRIERADVEKVTPKTVMLKRPEGQSLGPPAFNYRTRIPIDEAHWTAQDAVAAFVTEKERVMELHKTKMNILISQLKQMPQVLKTFEAAEKV